MIHDAPPGVCFICGVAVTEVADTERDEWRWAGPDGKTTGRDPDLEHLCDPARNPLGASDPYDALSKMASLLGTANARGAGKRSLTPLYWQVGREYSALKVRLDLGMSFHIHSAWTEPWDGPPVPWHCGSPGWHRPSGWYCRVCPATLPAPC
jgi:hypothetical protein